jgi:hypothetical protein
MITNEVDINVDNHASHKSHCNHHDNIFHSSQSSNHVECSKQSMTHIDQNNEVMCLTLDKKNMVLASLPSKEKILTLIDSGATTSLICATTISKSQYLSSLPKIAVPPKEFKVGNGQYMSTRFAIAIEVQMCGHKFIIKALAVDTLGGIGLVVGNDALEDIDANLDFRHHQLRFKAIPSY